MFKLDEYSEEYSSGSFATLTRETSQILKKKVNNARNVFSSAAHKIRKVFDSNHKKIKFINIFILRNIFPSDKDKITYIICDQKINYESKIFYSLQLPSHKDLIQKILPADFSPKEDTIHEDFNQGLIKAIL